MNYSIEDRLYLAALLRSISHSEVQAVYKAVYEKDFEGYLTKADRLLMAAGDSRGAIQRVHSPFHYLGSEDALSMPWVYGHQSLKLNEGFFPSANPKDEATVEQLWGYFGKSLKEIEARSYVARLKLAYILEALHRYAVTIPNPTGVNPEVSWYDHAKMRAGIALCLYRHDAVTYPDEPLLMVRADISGIQDFIGSVSSKNASKSLKGRSFYVQLLSDAVLRMLLQQLKLHGGNVVYGSGGSFFVLAPHSSDVIEALEAFERAITAKIFEAHNTRISMVIGWQPVRESQMLSGKIDEAIKVLFDEVINTKKSRKFSSYIDSDFTAFFEPSEEGGRLPVDTVTGEELSENQKIYTLKSDGVLPLEKELETINASDYPISEMTYKQILLGQYLRDTDYILVTEEPIGIKAEDAEKYEFQPIEGGPFYYLVLDRAAERERNKVTIESARQKSNQDNNGERIEIDETNKTLSTLMLYGGRGVPTFEVGGYKDSGGSGDSYRKGDVKDFSHMAFSFLRDKKEVYKTSASTGLEVSKFKRIGVLKMDVDGLGNVFKSGLSGLHLTFTRYAALSRNLDWFFKGYLNQLWQNEILPHTKDAYRNYSQIIYSGGDDLFIVGRWDVVIAFAEKIKEQFAIYTGAVELSKERTEDAQKKKIQLTLSGGVAIVTDKFPIMKASAMADAAEKKAKAHDTASKKKNSFCLLGMPLHWEEEYAEVKRLKEQMGSYMHTVKDSQSLIHKIQRHAAMARAYYATLDQYRASNGAIEAPTPRWVWLAMYDLARLRDHLKKDGYITQSDLVNDWINCIFTSTRDEANDGSTRGYSFMEKLGIAARWAELEYRTFND